MDPSLGFARLLGLAQENQSNKTNNKLLNTKISGAKKEKRDKAKLASNVQKFLEKKEAEEKRKRIEEKLARERLNEMRSERDKNKIAKHLKVTKSANYSVLSDAVDTKNTADTLKGRKQCDEDDYGFASSTSQNLYEKLMNKYEADPEDPMAKFSRAKPKQLVDIQSAKERVKNALRKEEENPMIPGKRRRHVNDSERPQPGCVGNRGVSGGVKPKETERERNERWEREREERETERRREEERKAKSEKERLAEEARKKRIANAKKAGGPVNFEALLKIANEKKDIPIKLEKKKPAKESEFGSRPMTEQEKKEFIRENEARLRREGKLPPKQKAPEKKNGRTSPELDLRDSRKKDKSPDIRKREKSPEVDLRDTRKMKPAEPGPMFHSAVKKSMPEKKEESRAMSDYERQKKEFERKMKELEEQKMEMENKHREMASKHREMENKQKILQHNERKRLEFQRQEEERKRKEIERKRELRKQEEEKKELEDMQSKYKEMQKKMKEMEARLKGPAENSKASNKSSSSSSSTKRDPRDVEARHFPGEKRKDQGRRNDRRDDRRDDRNSYKRRIESDSEDEYDSELDDFIDDSEAKVDISKEIRSIFGYDKRKYRDESDEDDRSMENNRFSSIMMEEARSARIGRQEDLEDMRREEEELRRKKMKKRR